MEADISTIHRDGTAVDDYNEPDPKNIMQSDDVLLTPSSITFGFHINDTWRQSGNFPVGRFKLKMPPIPSIQNMSHLNFFMNVYFMEYIKDLVIPETKKRLD